MAFGAGEAFVTAIWSVQVELKPNDVLRRSSFSPPTRRLPTASMATMPRSPVAPVPVCLVHAVPPTLLRSTVPASPTAMKTVPVKATPLRFAVVPLERVFHFTPSALTAMRPFSPTATKTPPP